MDNEKPCFLVENYKGMATITNNTAFKMWISLKAIPQKRKPHDAFVIQPKSFLMFNDPDFEMDLTKMLFSFTDIKG